MNHEQEVDDELANLSDYYMSNEYLYWTTLTQLRLVVLTLLTTELREFIENKPTNLSTIKEYSCTYEDKCVIITETMQQINQTIETVLAACELDMDGTVIH